MSLNAYLDRPAEDDGEEHTLAALLGQRKGAARPALFLDIEASDGDRYGLPYALLLGVVLRRGGAQLCLEIAFTSHRVTVHGRNLQAVYPLLLSNVLGRLQSSQGVEPEEASFWIDRIDVLEADQVPRL
jgi:hypothetical protein